MNVARRHALHWPIATLAHWSSGPALTLLCVCLLWTGLSGQRPEHRDRLSTGLVPVVTTFPSGRSDIKPADIEILDDGRVVIPATVVTGERPLLRFW